MAKQRTISREATCEGIGLHTGHATVMTFQPAPAGTGLAFRRVDLPGVPVIPADIDHVQGTERGTTLGIGDAQVHTVEHVLAALYALEIDNCYIDVDASEPPVVDGSAQAFTTALCEAGIVEQDADRDEFIIGAPFTWALGDISVTVAPADTLRLSYTIEYDHPVIGTQSASIAVSPDAFINDVAPARTYCFLQDVEALKAAGLIRGGSIENAVVVGEETVLNDGLRYPDEFVRHKLIDLLGDLALFGLRLRGHVTAVRAGHTAHVAFVRHLRAQATRRDNGESPPADGATLDGLGPAIGLAAAQRFLPMNREAIQRVLPHRDPFLFLDEITELREDFACGSYRLREDAWFFRGHFPRMPVTPGVIMLEALAQTGGVLTRLILPDPDSIPVLLTMERVKFRTAVRPGDVLRLEVTPERLKRRIGKLSGRALLRGEVACEGTIMFSMVPADTIRNAMGSSV